MMVKLLNMLRDDPELLDSAPTHRMQISRDGLEDYKQFARTTTIRTSKGKPFVWMHAEAGKLLKYVCDSSPEFRSIFESTLAGLHGAPLDVIEYYDEITPGNVLRPDNARKIHAIYFSFRQFPKEFLHCCEAWIPLGVIRSSVVKTFPAQFSTAMKEIIRATISESTLADGIVIDLSEGPRLARAEMTNNLADGAALKGAFECKGSAGIQPCMHCKNVVAKSFGKALRKTTYLVTLSCTDVSRFDLRTDQDLWDAADQLSEQRPRMKNGPFKKLERSHGLNHNPDGVLQCIPLRQHFRPIATLTYDPSHVWFANGVANRELHFLMKALGKLRPAVTWAHVREWMYADQRRISRARL